MFVNIHSHAHIVELSFRSFLHWKRECSKISRSNAHRKVLNAIRRKLHGFY